jgi:hypothetical protein
VSLLVYVGAVLRHWIASMSGIAALVVATALQWRYITPTEGTLDPRLWWTIAAICFVAAMFLAWLDEYRRRRSAEASGPKLVLEHIPENQPHHPPLWRITNSGETDALNIDSDELQSYGTSARIIGIQRLAKGQSADLTFRVWRNNRSFGKYKHPVILLDAVKKGAESTTEDLPEYFDAISNVVIPVHLVYNDPGGAAYESFSEMRWDHPAHRGEARHIRSGPIEQDQWWIRVRYTLRRFLRSLSKRLRKVVRK